LLLIPYKGRALHGAGIAVVLERTGFPSDDIVEVRTQAIVAFLGRMAGPACVVECSLPRLGVGALTRRLLGHGRETQKHQECGADQSRDCGAGHKCSWRLNARESAPLHYSLTRKECSQKSYVSIISPRRPIVDFPAINPISGHRTSV